MAKEAIAFKNKVIKTIKKDYANPEELISMIDDKDICFAVTNGFSVQTFIAGLIF